MSTTAERRKTLEGTLRRVLTPAERTMVRELVSAERPESPTPQAEDLFYWLRLNMPVAAARIDTILHPSE